MRTTLVSQLPTRVNVDEAGDVPKCEAYLPVCSTVLLITVPHPTPRSDKILPRVA